MKQGRTVFVRGLASVLAGALAIVTAGVVARAMPGGATKSALSFAGTLLQGGVPMSGAQKLTFDFKKAGKSACAAAATIDVTVDARGGFQVEIPLDGCPTTLFDGGDVTVDISVAGVTGVLASGPVNPVPYAKYADQVGSPDCPVGYARVGTTAPIVCTRGNDEIVKVGFGAAAFWIDRYEASIWSAPDGTGSQYGESNDNYPATFPSNGQITALPGDLLYAVSKKGVTPSGNITWFRANLACLASGKRLPTGPEWLLAATGTNDPGAGGGVNGACNTTGPSKRKTGALNADISCVSVWGAEDMIGNLWEWTAEWYAAPSVSGNDPTTTWPTPAFHGDLIVNVASYAYMPGLGFVQGLPAAAARGGDASGTLSGTFAFALDNAPGSPADLGRGLRCVVPR